MKPVELPAEAFRLKASASSTLIDELDAALPRAGVSAVVGDGNRQATPCEPEAANLLAAFCWQDGDNAVEYWIPQGITTTADSTAEASYDGVRAIVVSWYYDQDQGGTERGIRLSFVDYPTPGAATTYRHVLLVEPQNDEDGHPSFGPVDLHAGGIAWYGDYIYVADTWEGLRVFDVRHIWRTSTDDDTAIGYKPEDGSYQAFGYKYVLPQVFRYTQSTSGGQAPIRFSCVALDRTSTPDSVIVGEYANVPDGQTARARVFRFPLDENSHTLAASADGYVHATEAYDTATESIQGAAAIDGKFFLSISAGANGNGHVGTFTRGGELALHTGDLPIGPEDWSYWAANDQLWNLAEYAGKRSVFAIRASAY
ncbi:hypothetical protein ACFQ07_03180 [Actinomadura adrarensis]|uniref:Secreted protein n=1 Tax=Actinomadura adrarensis TaxID=1819600 RepID=A0ABW3CB93_9ACTN